jgi:hypothetical protein
MIPRADLEIMEIDISSHLRNSKADLVGTT